MLWKQVSNTADSSRNHRKPENLNNYIVVIGYFKVPMHLDQQTKSELFIRYLFIDMQMTHGACPFLAWDDCNTYILRLCYDISVRLCVRLSVTEVHWRIIANLGFKFRSQFTAHCGCGVLTELNIYSIEYGMRARGKGSSPGRVEGSSRAMLATARPFCLFLLT